MARPVLALLALSMLLAVASAQYVPYMTKKIYRDTWAGTTNCTATDTDPVVRAGTAWFVCVANVRYQADTTAAGTLNAYTFKDNAACLASEVGSVYLRMEAYTASACIVDGATSLKIVVANSVSAVAGFRVKTSTFASQDDCKANTSPTPVAIAADTVYTFDDCTTNKARMIAVSDTTVNQYFFGTSADCTAFTGYYDMKAIDNTKCTAGDTKTRFFSAKYVTNAATPYGLLVSTYTDTSCATASSPAKVAMTDASIKAGYYCAQTGTTAFWRFQLNTAGTGVDYYVFASSADCKNGNDYSAGPTAYTTAACRAGTGAVAPYVKEVVATKQIAARVNRVIWQEFADQTACEAATTFATTGLKLLPTTAGARACWGAKFVQAEGNGFRTYTFETAASCDEVVASTSATLYGATSVTPATGVTAPSANPTDNAGCFSNTQVTKYAYVAGIAKDVVAATAGTYVAVNTYASLANCNAGTSPTLQSADNLLSRSWDIAKTEGACIELKTAGSYVRHQVDSTSGSGSMTLYTFKGTGTGAAAAECAAGTNYDGTPVTTSANGNCFEATVASGNAFYRIHIAKTVNALAGRLLVYKHTGKTDCTADSAVPTVSDYQCIARSSQTAPAVTRYQYESGGVKSYVFPSSFYCGKGQFLTSGPTNFVAMTDCITDGTDSWKLDGIPYVPPAFTAYISERDYSSTSGTGCTGDEQINAYAHFNCYSTTGTSAFKRIQAINTRAKSTTPATAAAPALYEWTFATLDACETLSSAASTLDIYTASACHLDKKPAEGVAAGRDSKAFITTYPISSRIAASQYSNDACPAADTPTAVVEADVYCNGNQGFAYDKFGGAETLREYTFAASECPAGQVNSVKAATKLTTPANCYSVTGGGSFKPTSGPFVALGQFTQYIKVDEITSDTNGDTCAVKASTTVTVLAASVPFYCTSTGVRYQAEGTGINQIKAYQFTDKASCQVAVAGALTTLTAANALPAFNASKCPDGVSTPKVSIVATDAVAVGTATKQLNATVYTGNNTCTSTTNITYSVLVNAHCAGAVRYQVETVGTTDTIMAYTFTDAAKCTSSLTDAAVKANSLAAYVADTCAVGGSDGFKYTIASAFPAVPAGYPTWIWVQTYTGNTSCTSAATSTQWMEDYCVGKWLFSVNPQNNGIWALDFTDSFGCGNASATNVSLGLPFYYDANASTGYQTGFGSCRSDGVNGYKFALAPADVVAAVSGDSSLSIALFNNTNCNAANATGTIVTNPATLPALCDPATGLRIQAEGTGASVQAFNYVFTNVTTCGAAVVGTTASLTPKTVLPLNTCLPFGAISVNITVASYVWPSPPVPSPVYPSPPVVVASPVIPSPTFPVPPPPVVIGANTIVYSLVLLAVAMLF